MGNRYNEHFDMFNSEEREALSSWKLSSKRENENVHTNNGWNPQTQPNSDNLIDFDPVNASDKNRGNDYTNNDEGKDAQAQTRDEITDDGESDDTSIFDPNKIWKLPIEKEAYTTHFNSIDTFNASRSVRGDKHQHKQDISEFDPINESERVRTRNNKNDNVYVNLFDDEENDTLKWKQPIRKKEVNNTEHEEKKELSLKQPIQKIEIKNNEHEKKKELSWEQLDQKIEIHCNGNNNENGKKETLLQKQQTQKLNELVSEFDPYCESDRVRENIANSSPIKSTFDIISVWENFYNKKNDRGDNQKRDDNNKHVETQKKDDDNKHVQTQKKGEIIDEFDPLSDLGMVWETNHNKSDNKYEGAAKERKQHTKKNEENHSRGDDANDDEKEVTLLQKQHNHNEIMHEFDPFSTTYKNHDVNMLVNKKKYSSSWRSTEEDDDGPKRDNNPDDWWSPPSQYSPFEILGEKRINLKRIQASTNLHMIYNKNENRIEMWGSTEDIDEAKRQLNDHVKSLLEFTKEHEPNRKYERSFDKKNKMQEFESEPVPVKNKQELDLKRKKEQELELRLKEERELEIKRKEEQELELRRKEERELELRRKEERELELRRKEERELELRLKEERELEIKHKEEQELELKRKEERELELKFREEQEHDESIYLSRPDYSQRFPFNECFVFPTTDIHISRFLGMKDEILNPIRIKYKCHIWHDPTLPCQNAIQIVGNSRESVEIATTRVKNLFIKILASRSIPHATQVADSLLGTHHMVEQPHEPCEIRITDPLPRFYLLYLPNYESKVKLIKPVYMPSDLYFDFFHMIRDSNLKRFEDSLLKALETVHLFDEEIKMRVRFGHVCFTRIPLSKDYNNDVSLTINQLNDRVLKKTRTESKFATRIASEKSQLDDLIEVLSGSDQGWFCLPSREFKIHATRKAEDKEFPCAFDIQLRNGNEKNNLGKHNGKIGLWSAIIGEKNVLDINMSCLSSEYSWKLQVNTAKRLLKAPPQENFIKGLRICPQGHLVYSNTKDINVLSVYEKTKWKYPWNNDYIVEITKYDFWELSKYKYTRELEFFLNEEPFVVSFGVSFYKKSWDDNFALNLNLEVGEAPEWHPQDVMDSLADETGRVGGLINDIQTFLNVLGSKVSMPAEHELYSTTTTIQESPLL
ncbi:hypothetical protein RclHR1_02100017 [Rhizophagus clarus]|uniref:S-layer protein n=1 Tax=Rhizophagus clarus TaxID=94130 RepID=A0A2Z6RLD4_9GLOM|nr:hypothetical protein RclHR1_02100017 [Rhizophagus clarus]GES98407.1 S-layer protein [Rhizophagus clarus]